MSRGNRRRWSVRLTRWHRWAGIAAALFVVVLSITGLALQHAPALGLDRNPVGSPSVARALGIDTPAVRAYRVGERWVLGTGEALYLDGERVTGLSAAPSGAVATDFGIVVAAGGDILLVGEQGRLVEHLRAGAGLPGAVERIGITADGDAVVATADRRYRPKRRWLAFAPYDGAVAAWSRLQDPPARLAQRVRDDTLGRAVTWARLLRAIHSGRIAGTAGVVIMDAAAVLLLVLAGSGGYLWWRRR